MNKKIKNCGELNKKIGIYKLVKTPNSLEDVESISLYATVWAKVIKTTSNDENDEKFENDEIFNVETFDVTIRKIKGLKDNMIIKINNIQYKIFDINIQPEKLVEDFYIIRCQKLIHSI